MDFITALDLANFILSLEVTPISDPHSGAKNGKELLRARSMARKVYDNLQR